MKTVWIWTEIEKCLLQIVKRILRAVRICNFIYIQKLLNRILKEQNFTHQLQPIQTTVQINTKSYSSIYFTESRKWLIIFCEFRRWVINSAVKYFKVRYTNVTHYSFYRRCTLSIKSHACRVVLRYCILFMNQRLI